MRLSLRINKNPQFVASVAGPGYLSAHLNMKARPKIAETSNTIRVIGVQTFEGESVYSNWPEREIHIGDLLELLILEDGEGDPPENVRTSSAESETSLLLDADLSRNLLALVAEFEAHLTELLAQWEKRDSAKGDNSFRTALGHVMGELGDRLLYPVYRRHKELIPNDMKGEIL